MPEITDAQALRLGIAALEEIIQSISTDANICDLLGATYPQAINASRQREKLREAIARLEAMSKRKTKATA